MRLLELVRALRTSDEAVETGRGLAERLGKEVILTKDRAGFIVNMLLIPYLVAAVRMYEEGFATRDDIDTGMRLGCAHPMGPLQLTDFIGLDVIYEVCNSLFEEFKDPAYAPPPLLKRMLAAGYRGRKSGQGFYTYG
jgi:3-hydroxybutyryl-CoA dehydrogenase